MRPKLGGRLGSNYEIVDLVTDPLVALVPVCPLMPYELHLKSFREPWNVYPRHFGQALAHQASRHQCNELAAGDNARNNEE